jgi:ankyrin repeat protein
VTRSDFTKSLGLDIQALDYRDNTLVHELALEPGTRSPFHDPQHIPLWNQFMSLGIDVNQRNQQGRTTLQILVAMIASDHGRSYKASHFSAIDLVISKVDQRDFQGLTALHLASIVSENVTKKLLDAGSDPTLSTLDSLTPPHLVGRARRGNIVGILLAFGKRDRVYAIDAKDEKGNTPLYYACRSGRLVSVQPLLQAGADVSHKNLYFTCATFEEDQELWKVNRHLVDTERDQCASGLTISDTTRPNMPPINNYSSSSIDDLLHSTRLEEIVDLLVEHHCDSNGLMDTDDFYDSPGALDTAASAAHTYTFSCLLRARGHLLNSDADSETNDQDESPLVQTQMVEAIVKFLRNADIAATNGATHLVVGKANQEVIIRALKRRQYHAI